MDDRRSWNVYDRLVLAIGIGGPQHELNPETRFQHQGLACLQFPKGRVLGNSVLSAHLVSPERLHASIKACLLRAVRTNPS
jgi:hypothetical protein